MGKHGKRDKAPRMTLPEMAEAILGETGAAMSAHEVWAEAVSRGWAGRAMTAAERPETSMAGWLYKTAKKGGHGIVAEGEGPVRFRLRETGEGRPRGTKGKNGVESGAGRG